MKKSVMKTIIFGSVLAASFLETDWWEDSFGLAPRRTFLIAVLSWLASYKLAIRWRECAVHEPAHYKKVIWRAWRQRQWRLAPWRRRQLARLHEASWRRWWSLRAGRKKPHLANPVLTSWRTRGTRSWARGRTRMARRLTNSFRAGLHHWFSCGPEMQEIFHYAPNSWRNGVASASNNVVCICAVLRARPGPHGLWPSKEETRLSMGRTGWIGMDANSGCCTITQCAIGFIWYR